jgi:hypothetical protein
MVAAHQHVALAEGDHVVVVDGAVLLDGLRPWQDPLAELGAGGRVVEERRLANWSCRGMWRADAGSGRARSTAVVTTSTRRRIRRRMHPPSAVQPAVAATKRRSPRRDTTLGS